MKRAALYVSLLITTLSFASAHGAGLDGFVYLHRDIGPGFKSDADVIYLNDLNGPGDADLSGTHRVDGPQSFQTAVTGNPRYEYTLEGPAEAGGCYTTSVHAIANPPGIFDTIQKDFEGPRGNENAALRRRSRSAVA